MMTERAAARNRGRVQHPRRPRRRNARAGITRRPAGTF